MSVEKLKKIEIIAIKGIKDKLLDVLQHQGSVHILSINNSILGHPSLIQHEESPVLSEDIGLLGQVEYNLNYLKRFEESKKGILESLKRSPIKTSAKEINSLISGFDVNKSIKTSQRIEKSLNSLEEEKHELNKGLLALTPWRSLGIPLKYLAEGTRFVEFYPIILSEDLIEPLRKSLSALSDSVSLSQIDNLGLERSLIIMCLRSNRERVQEILARFEIQTLSLPPFLEDPLEWIKNAENRLDEIEVEINNLKEEGKGLLSDLNKLKILYDHYLNNRFKCEIQENFGYTQHSIIIRGWIKEKDIPALKDSIKGFNELVDCEFIEPARDDTPPVALSNNRFNSPFEFVTKLYDLPHYNELDPTPILAPFFFLFFGLCLTDLGYGLLLLIISYWGLKRLYLTGTKKRIFQLFFLCGISTFFCGILAGSWFGDIVNYLPAGFNFLKNIKGTLAILDPLKDPLKFLIFALCLGFIQVILGILVQMYKNIKAKDYYSAFLLRIPWTLLLSSLVLFVIIKDQGTSLIFKWMAITCAIIICLSEARSEKNILKRIGTGLLALYSTIGYYADMLSYCRLLALGLATAVIANVVNQMAMLSKGIPIVGIVVMFLLLVGGHIFNLLINLLGAFVHTSRLQFVEFFTKFFEGGGKAFIPFERQGKYTYIE